MWAYIYDNYYEDFDFFHIGGDDLYVLVENLRLYLESEEIRTAANGGVYLPDGSETSQTPLFLGRRFAYQGDMNDIFISGGSGYTMNKAALKALVTEGLPNVFPHAHTFSEDTMIARMFRKRFGVVPYETKDEAGGERYMVRSQSLVAQSEWHGAVGWVLTVCAFLLNGTSALYAGSPLGIPSPRRSVQGLVRQVLNQHQGRSGSLCRQECSLSLREE